MGMAQLEGDLPIPVFVYGNGTIGGRSAYPGARLWRLRKNETQKSGMMVFGTRLESRSLLNKIGMPFTSVCLYQRSSSIQPKMGDCLAWQLIEIWAHFCKTKCRATMCFTGPGFLNGFFGTILWTRQLTFGFRELSRMSWLDWPIECEEGLLLMDIPNVKERCCLSQLRVVYCVCGKLFYNMFRSIQRDHLQNY